MRKLLFIGLLLIFILIAGACKKCMTCRIEYKSVSGDTVRELERCGRKKILDDFEDNAREIADTLNGTVTCVTE